MVDGLTYRQTSPGNIILGSSCFPASDDTNTSTAYFPLTAYVEVDPQQSDVYGTSDQLFELIRATFQDFGTEYLSGYEKGGLAAESFLFAAGGSAQESKEYKVKC